MPVMKNEQHERFCQLRVSGLTQTDAYDKAGFKGSRANASHLSSRVDVQTRIAELMADKNAKAAPLDLDDMDGNQLQKLAAREAMKQGKADVLARIGAIRGEADGSLAALDITKAVKDMPDAGLAVHLLPTFRNVFARLGRSVPDDDKLLPAIVGAMGNGGSFDKPKPQESLQ